ncbi:MAG TPA: UDP-N-acetylmuramoyl-L-alanyl-D-glutamate--2,6-diaminopimelate ligase, partial [Actinomycetota bacterium]|nr:UDP-N-acetylmuramoyl-L-alanyl-D-glutamate--2,6-diaminopimelate ligase [Actinomycetota bacterium]
MNRTASDHTVGALAAATRDLLIEVRGDDRIQIGGLTRNSADVESGDLFFCVPGTTSDGHLFAAEAVTRGAAALCVERILEVDVPQIVVSDVRRSMGRIGARFWNEPAASMMLLGITGTNGKTTTAYLLESILNAAGRTTGLVGTIETRIVGRRLPGVRTTPDSLEMQQLMAEMAAEGVDAVAMEVTSHGLALHRVEGLRFAVAAFTNLSQDHLDFHAGMEEYFAAKRSLFSVDLAELGVVNVDDPHGRRLMAEAEIDCIGFGTAPEADVRAEDVSSGPRGTEFLVAHDGGELKVATSLIGLFNVSNCLAATAVALQAGVEPGAIEAGISNLKAVPGRFEPVDVGQPFTVVVDYAHTPDSLDNVLRAARRFVVPAAGRVLCTFGCGGDRDRGKRPLMGSVAARLADFVVVTSDNPRSEDPRQIVDAIVEGVLAETPDGPDDVLVDRRAAIARVLAEARPGDIVVIAGKGHET